MNATILLCLISTTVFCIGARSTLALAMGQPKWLAIFTHRSKALAKRVVRGYLLFSSGLLTAFAFAGMVVSYVELFSLI